MTTTQTPPTKTFEIINGGDACGTCLHGYLTANYKDIVKLLGKPSDSDGYKVDAEWDITINGNVMTVYNYKNGKNYNGSRGIPKTKITDWHIGAGIGADVTEEANYLASQLNGSYRTNYL